jgi:hypothetical protein
MGWGIEIKWVGESAANPAARPRRLNLGVFTSC